MLRQALQVLLLAVGAWLVIDAGASPGIMVAATILLGRALQPVEHLIGGWKQLLDARGAWRRMAERPPRRAGDGGVTLSAPQGRLEVERVVFGHDKQRPALIKGVQFALEAGESLGLVGPSASGKTTLARLLLGIWRPQAGAVRLDGADIAQWNRDDARRARRLSAAGRRAVRRHRGREHRAARRGRRCTRHRRGAARACARDDPAAAAGLRHADRRRRRACFRAGSASASRSRARCTASRSWSCSTSRMRTSTPKATRRCARRLQTLKARGTTVVVIGSPAGADGAARQAGGAEGRRARRVRRRRAGAAARNCVTVARPLRRRSAHRRACRPLTTPR